MNPPGGPQRTDTRNRKELRRTKALAALRQLAMALRREKVHRLLLICLVILAIGALGFYFFEIMPAKDPTVYGTTLVERMGSSLWWSCVTLCTVGYGDIAPKSLGGRTVGIFVMFAGIVVMSLITAIIASVLVERKIREEKGLESVSQVNHLVMCGWNENAAEVLLAIKQSKEAPKTVVLINDLEEEKINEIKYRFREDLDISFIKGDFVNESVLERANIPEAHSAIILSDTSSRQDRAKADERAILATLAIKHIQEKVRVTAELIDRENEAHLRRARADEIVIRGQYASFFIANSALSPGILSVMGGLLSLDQKHQILKIEIPQRFIGQKFRQTFEYVRDDLGAILFGIISVSKGMRIGDLLTDDLSAIDLFIKRKFEEAGTDLGASDDQVEVMINPPDDYKIRENDFAVVIYSQTDKEKPR
ncbi:MAG: ion channel [Candidatus Eremiobacteraeota bacterium]|nr:ion channel [Candidatus Eremiobacteraeota bacterium]